MTDLSPELRAGIERMAREYFSSYDPENKAIDDGEISNDAMMELALNAAALAVQATEERMVGVLRNTFEAAVHYKTAAQGGERADRECCASCRQADDWMQEARAQFEHARRSAEREGKK